MNAGAIKPEDINALTMPQLAATADVINRSHRFDLWANNDADESHERSTSFETVDELALANELA